MKEGKVEGKALHIAEKRRSRQRRKGKIYPTECRILGIAKRHKHAF